MSSLRQGPADLQLPIVAQHDMHAVTRRFHGAVQVLPGAHGRRGQPRYLPEEQRSTFSRPDRRSGRHEVGRRGALERPRQIGGPRLDHGRGEPQESRQVRPCGIDGAAVPGVRDHAQAHDRGGVANGGGVAVGDVAQRQGCVHHIRERGGADIAHRIPLGPLDGLQDGDGLRAG